MALCTKAWKYNKVDDPWSFQYAQENEIEYIIQLCKIQSFEIDLQWLKQKVKH